METPSARWHVAMRRTRLATVTAAMLLLLGAAVPASGATVGARSARSGEVQLCFAAGLGVTVGAPATFHVTIDGAHPVVTVDAGAGPTGTCVDVGTFRLGRVTVDETRPRGFAVQAITSNATHRSTSLRTAHFAGDMVAGTTTVTFADDDIPRDAHVGYLKVCKRLVSGSHGAPSTFDFVVDGWTYAVPTGGCSPAFEVFAGTNTITEVPVDGWEMTGCTATPASRLESCTTDTGVVTASVVKGNDRTATTVTVTNGVAPPGAIEVVSDQEGDCALLQTSEVDCWGLNDGAQLGDGSTTNTTTPTAVLAVGGVGDLSGVASLTFIGSGFCALLTWGEVACWGYNNDGYVGNGTITAPDTSPVLVSTPSNSGPLTGVVAVDSDLETACALTSAGDVYCWGYNGGDELGPNYVRSAGCAQYECSDLPVLVTSGVASVSAADGGTVDSESYCALLTTTGVECWGGGFGVTPVAVVLPSSSPLTGVTSVDNQGYETYCAILTSTGVDCWSDSNGHAGVANPVVGVGGSGTLSGVIELATGDGVAGETFPYDSTCALVTGGGVDCWGDNTYGELGVGTSPGGSASPVQVKGVGGIGLLTGATSIVSTGQQLYCVTVGASHVVDCWGWTGEIEGSINPYPSWVPFTIPSITGSGPLDDVTQLVAYSNQSECVLTALHTIDCWGSFNNDQLGSASDGAPPTQVVGIG